MRKVGCLAALLVLLMLVHPSPAQASEYVPPRFRLFEWINQARTNDLSWSYGLAVGRPHSALDHARLMAQRGYIFHCSLFNGGEAVGVYRMQKGQLWNLFRAFMDSPAHRAVLMSPYIHRIGIRGYAANGYRWMVIFVE